MSASNASPDRPVARLGIGSIVRHVQFGAGRIVAYEPGQYVIVLRGGDTRRVAFEYDRLEAQDREETPRPTASGRPCATSLANTAGSMSTWSWRPAGPEGPFASSPASRTSRPRTCRSRRSSRRSSASATAFASWSRRSTPTRPSPSRTSSSFRATSRGATAASPRSTCSSGQRAVGCKAWASETETQSLLRFEQALDRHPEGASDPLYDLARGIPLLSALEHDDVAQGHLGALRELGHRECPRLAQLADDLAQRPTRHAPSATSLPSGSARVAGRPDEGARSPDPAAART